MSVKQPLALIGRLAIQCKMITMEQLQEATRAQGRNPDKRLGEILVEKGFIVEAQVQKLKKLQRDLVVKHRARQAASGISVPARPAPSATPEVAQPVLDDASPSTPGSPSTPSSPAAPPPPLRSRSRSPRRCLRTQPLSWRKETRLVWESSTRPRPTWTNYMPFCVRR